MDRKEEEKLKNDLADAVLITAAAQKFNAVGGWDKFGGLLWGVLLILGAIAFVLLPVLVAFMMLTGRMTMHEAFEEFGAAFGIVFIAVYLLIRWFLRTIIKKVTRNPHYFDNHRTIMEVSQGFGCVMIIVSVVIAVLSIASTENTFWFFVIAFTGCFIPLSRFLPGKQNQTVPPFVAASDKKVGQKYDLEIENDDFEMEDDDFEQF